MTKKRAVHAPRITLYNEHVQILEDIAISHGYVKTFDLDNEETTGIIPTIIRDIITSYGAMTTTPLYELLDFMIANAIEQKNTDLLDKIRESSELSEKSKEEEEIRG